MFPQLCLLIFSHRTLYLPFPESRGPMKRIPITALLLSSTLLALGHAAPTVNGLAFFGDPPDAHHPWAVHDRNRPQPVIVTPGTFSTADKPGKPPSDAVVLFDGSEASLANWEADKPIPEPTKWIVKEGAMECVPGSGFIRTKEKFGDVQLHVEWAAPKNVKGAGQGRGNSGIFLMGLAEVQVLDNFNNPAYADGMAGAIYGINPPMANALLAPGEFQMVDIVFRRPIFKGDQQVDAGHITVFINNVLVQDATPLEGPGYFVRRSKPLPFPESGPIKFQDHGNPVRYRNVWLRPLPPRASEGDTNGYLSAEVTSAKRAATAAEIRAEAAKLTDTDKPLPKLLGLMESLVYENDAPTVQQVNQLADGYLAMLKALPANQLADRKNEVMSTHRAGSYLLRHRVLSAFALVPALESIIKAHGWDKKK